MMEAPASPSPPPPAHDPRKLLWATLGAVVVAAIVLVVAILPAEYGIDPTGIGRAAGFSRMSESGAVTAVDDDARTLYSFDLSWQVRETTVLQQGGGFDATRTEEDIRFDFAGVNLTAMEAVLSWHAGGPVSDPSIFELSMRGPEGRRTQFLTAESDANGTGLLSVTIPWRTAPVPAYNASGVYEVDARTDTSAQGPWAVLVRMFDPGTGRDAPVETNAWSLTVRARAFAITNVGSFGGDGAGDKVSFELKPGSAVEYKLAMDAGAELGYLWTSTAALQVDFHGDEGPGTDPTTHKQVRADRDQGNFSAPFTGRHGWWFNNDGDRAVTVTLETRGDYEIIGVV